MISSPNRDLLTRVARRLEPLLEQLVFVGGQVTGLLITDPVAAHVRPTDDVDVICDVASRPDYYRLGVVRIVFPFRREEALIVLQVRLFDPLLPSSPMLFTYVPRMRGARQSKFLSDQRRHRVSSRSILPRASNEIPSHSNR